MKKVAYFPGCTLKTKAKELDRYARKSAEALGFYLDEIENWQCCGGVFTTSRDEIATKLSSVRALADAQKKNQTLKKVKYLQNWEEKLLLPPKRVVLIRKLTAD